MTNPRVPRPASRLTALTAYAPPGVRDSKSQGPNPRSQISDLESRKSCLRPLKLDANEGRLPDDALLDRLRAIDADALRRYARPAALEAKLGATLGIDPSGIVVTADADDALDRLCRATLEPGRCAILTDPTFEMLPRYARLAGAKPIEIPWLDRPFPAGEIERAIDERTGAVFLVTPNNPTGAVARAAEIVRIAERAPASVVVADLAYVEFADEDPTPALLGLPNVVMTRTFSKAWGLAGLRVGYAIGPAHIISWLRAVGHPYPTSSVGLALAGAALDLDHSGNDAYIAQAKRERRDLAALLRSLGADAADSQGNFVLARVPEAWALADVLAARGIHVRRFARGSTLADRLRITCPGDPADFDSLTRALREVLR